MLLTICPNCSAQFKVQPEQLNVRQGRVMCGRCRQVFNAFQSLTRVEEAAEAHVASLQQALSEPAASDPNHPTPVGHDEPAAFSAIDSAGVPVADSLFLREEPLPLPAAFSAATPVWREPVPMAAMPTPSGDPADFALLQESNSAVVPVSPFRSREEIVAEPAIDLSDEVNPLLLDPPEGRVAFADAPSRAWSLGVFVLFVVLLTQASYAFRTTLVSNYPQLRPTANQLCEMAGCSIPWGRDDTALEIVASELMETPGKPGRILLTAILVNRGKAKQDLPSLELRLTDNANQVVVRRVLHPGDYLGRAIGKDEGLEPKTELYVNLNLELGDKALASGYGLLPFYP